MGHNTSTKQVFSEKSKLIYHWFFNYVPLSFTIY